MKKPESGIAHLGLVLVVVVIALATFAGWRVYKMQTKPAAPTNTVAAPKAEDRNGADPSVITNKDFNFAATLPKGWTAKDDSYYFDGTPHSLFVELSKDGKNMANLITKEGIGGDCQPKSTDKPHAAGNECPTREVLAFAENPTGYIVKVKFSSSDGTEFGYCYQPKNPPFGPTEKPSLNEPIMGFQLLCGPDDIHVINQDLDDASNDFFESAIGKELEAILKTIEFTGY